MEKHYLFGNLYAPNSDTGINSKSGQPSLFMTPAVSLL